MDITTRFDFDSLDHSKDNTPNLVISLRAPSLDWVAKRPQIAILPVVDLSGSMQGPKLEYAKQSVLKLIEHLQEGDYAGLVTFSDRAKVVVKPQRITGEVKDKLKKAAQGLRIGGGTNFADGMITALDVIQQLDLPAKFLHRVIMFTDGMPTIGICDNNTILAMLEKKMARATVSAFGYGDGDGEWSGCDQSFLTELSNLGRGNYAYVKDPDDALGAFGKELGGLLSTYATDLRLEIEPSNGAHVVKPITNIEHEEDVTGLVEVPISDILGEETRHFVFATKTLKTAKVFPRETTIFDVRLSYDMLTEDGTKVTETAEAKAKVRFVRAKDAQAKPHTEVDQIIALHQTIRAQLEAEEAAEKGDYEQAVQVMNFIAEDVGQRGHQNVAQVALTTSGRVGSAAMYVQNAGYLRSVAHGGTRAYGTSALDGEAAQQLASCNVSLSNSAMDEYATSFTTESTTGGEQPAASGELVIPANVALNNDD
jgi:Ca-activated chloride channel family protein